MSLSQGSAGRPAVDGFPSTAARADFRTDSESLALSPDGLWAGTHTLLGHVGREAPVTVKQDVRTAFPSQNI